MTTSTIVAMLISLGIPLLITAITKDALSQPWKQLILLLLTSIVGVWTSLAGALPATLNQWEHALLNVLMAYLTAAISYLATWKDSRTRERVRHATAGFGFGPPPEHERQ